MFDPNAARSRNQKANQSRAIVTWVQEGLPAAIKTAVAGDPAALMVNVREVACGDPNCSPIDTVLAFVFRNGRQAMTGIPLEMEQVLKEDVARAMADMEEELVACFENREFVHPGALPQLSAAAEATLDRLRSALRRELVGLSASDVVGVCASLIDVLEQIEDDQLGAQPTQQALPGLPGAPGQGPPRPAGDPASKILSASQKNDVEAVKACVERESISPSYANSLGQTPLHIASMWGNVEVAEYLIRAGADVHATNQLAAATPLHVAACSSKDANKRLECVKLLVAAGADATKRDADGLLPWQKVSGGLENEQPASRAMRDMLHSLADATKATGAGGVIQAAANGALPGAPAAAVQPAAANQPSVGGFAFQPGPPQPSVGSFAFQPAAPQPSFGGAPGPAAAFR